MNLQDYYRQKRRRAAARRWGIVFIVFLVLLAALWGFFWIPYFRVNNIAIENYTENNDVKSALAAHLISFNKFFLPRDNFFLLNKAEIARALKDGGFGAPEISKRFPGTLILRFVSEKPWLIFCRADKTCFYIGKKGILGERAPRFSDNPLPELAASAPGDLKIGDSIISESQAGLISALFNAFSGVGAVPAKAEVLSGSEARISAAEGWFILISFGLDPVKVSGDFKLLFDQEISDKRSALEYIDMRFPNKAFYKLKSIN